MLYLKMKLVFLLLLAFVLQGKPIKILYIFFKNYFVNLAKIKKCLQLRNEG